MTLQLGILMALACAFATNLGFLYKYRGARAAASVDIRHPVRSAGSLFGSKWFAIGMLVATGAWGFHVAALGLVLLAVTLPATGGSHSQFSLTGMIAFEGGLVGVGGLLIMGKRLGGPVQHHGMMLGAAAGILFGVSDIAIKAITGMIGDAGVRAGFLSPWMLTAVIASVAAFYAS